jgi:acetylornithine deacetylase/succinyl-diaminopimelate desuccinylase-like protein
VFLTAAYSQQYRADGQKAKGYIEYLASDQLQGRQTLTPGYQKAADYVAAKFKEWGLSPCGDEGKSYFQKVPISRPVTVNTGIPALSLDGRPFYSDDADFTLNSLSTAKTALKAEVVFVGYGISLPAKGLDEYAGLNVQGKVVLAFKGSPENFSQPRGFFTETAGKPPAPIGLTREETADQAKIKAAYEKGAAAILLYNPDPPAGAMPGMMMMGMPGGMPQTPALEIKRNFLAFDVTERVFRKILKQAPQESSREYGQKLDALRWDIRNRKPQSKPTGVIAVLKGYDAVQKYSGDGLNVIGKIEGVDPELKNQYIVLGGHLDHLGARGTVVMNGADDDASGVAVVMEAARVLGQAGFKPKRTIVFAGWCGEEMGLLGSNYFGTKPPAGITMDKVVANFNCDMVGLGDNIGAPGALNFPEIWEKVITRGQDPDVIAAVKPSTGGPGGSDHSTFITKGIVSMALMTGGGGGHPDYHDSGDDAHKIDPEILRKTAQFVVQGTVNLADETAVNLLVPDRLYLYNSLMMRVTNINTQLPGSAWKNTDFPDKGTLLAKMSEREIQRAAQAQAQAYAARAASPMRMMAASPAPAAPPAAPIRKNLIQGVRSAVFGGDAKLLEIGANALGFGRVEFSGDDGAWIVDGRLTESGKSALKTMEANGIVLHLVNPADDLLADVLKAVEKPCLVSGTYTLSPDAKALAASKKAVLSVDLDPADAAGSIEKADAAKKLHGGTANLVAFVKSTDNLNDLAFKRAFYFGLVKKGWTVEDINAYIGGSLRPLTAAGMPAMVR